LAQRKLDRRHLALKLIIVNVAFSVLFENTSALELEALLLGRVTHEPRPERLPGHQSNFCSMA
jgi:hypothetical protein